MPVKMIAVRTCYNHSESKEYQKGDSFTVATEKEAVRFERSKRAKRDDAKSAQAVKTAARRAEEKPAAPVVEKVMAPESSTTVPPSSTDDSAALVRQNRYRRSDMRSED
jgi:hypothetical protein